MSVVRPCIVCGKSCDVGDRNSDGTYAHRECLYKTMTRPWWLKK